MDPLPEVTEMGQLGVCQLKRSHYISQQAIKGNRISVSDQEQQWQHLLAFALGLTQSQLTNLLFSCSHFSELEHQIEALVGQSRSEQIDRYNLDRLGQPHNRQTLTLLEQIKAMNDVLSHDDLAHWQRYGYVIARNLVSEADRKAAVEQILLNQQTTLENQQSWYSTHTSKGRLSDIQNPAFERIRANKKVHKAYSQLWQTEDLWPSVDNASFYPPNNDKHLFQGPDLHWDMNFAHAQTLNIQGIVYLTDTAAEQGATTMVPGFQHKLADWLTTLEAGVDPIKQDLHALGSQPIAGNAGDMVIWHHALPHGSRPNLSDKPRIALFLSHYPGRQFMQLTGRDTL